MDILDRIRIFLGLLWNCMILSPEPHIPRPYRMHRFSPRTCWQVAGTIIQAITPSGEKGEGG